MTNFIDGIRNISNRAETNKNINWANQLGNKLREGKYNENNASKPYKRANRE